MTDRWRSYSDSDRAINGLLLYTCGKWRVDDASTQGRGRDGGWSSNNNNNNARIDEDEGTTRRRRRKGNGGSITKTDISNIILQCPWVPPNVNIVLPKVPWSTSNLPREYNSLFMGTTTTTKTTICKNIRSSTTTTNTRVCHRPKLFFLKKRPPFATMDGWNPITEYRINLFEPPTTMEGMDRGWGEVRGHLGDNSSNNTNYNNTAPGGGDFGNGIIATSEPQQQQQQMQQLTKKGEEVVVVASQQSKRHRRCVLGIKYPSLPTVRIASMTIVKEEEEEEMVAVVGEQCHHHRYNGHGHD